MLFINCIEGGTIRNALQKAGRFDHMPEIASCHFQDGFEALNNLFRLFFYPNAFNDP